MVIPSEGSDSLLDYVHKNNSNIYDPESVPFLNTFQDEIGSNLRKFDMLLKRLQKRLLDNENIEEYLVRIH